MAKSSCEPSPLWLATSQNWPWNLKLLWIKIYWIFLLLGYLGKDPVLKTHQKLKSKEQTGIIHKSDCLRYSSPYNIHPIWPPQAKHMLQRLAPSLPSLPPLRNSSADGGLRSSLFLQCAKCFLEDKLGNDKYSHSEDTRVALKKVTDGWRWQRAFCQSVVLVLMGNYMALVDTDEGLAIDDVAGIVLAAVVAACIWSAGLAIVVAFGAVAYMVLSSKTFRAIWKISEPAPSSSFRAGVNQQPPVH